MDAEALPIDAADEDEEGEDGFEDSPEGWAQHWQKEMEAAEDFLKPFHEQGKKSLQAYRDDKRTGGGPDGKQRGTKLNIYWRNLQVQRALMYGKTPSVEVSRTFGDANDDVARLAGEIQERVLNCDISRDGEDGYSTVMGASLDDRLPTGFGQARLFYRVEHETQPGKPAIVGPDGQEQAPAVEEQLVKKSEDVDVLFVHWRDFAYSPCRVWPENRWVGFKNEMRRKELKKRFLKPLMELTGKDEASVRLLLSTLPMNAKKAGEEGSTRSSASDDMDARAKDPWQRAEVWEIWDKETKRVFWWVKGFEFILDMKDDPLRVRGFFPCTRPMLANVTNESLLAKSDYAMLRDLYDEIDSVSWRITLLQRVIRVAGVFDKTAADIARLVSEGGNNDLIGIENWNRWAEKGGLAGQVDWLPLEPIIAALAQLRDYRTELKAEADEISGMSDIVRGESSVQAATATEQGIKAKYASVRMGALQKEFATFCSDIQRLKGEIMSNLFDDATYLAKSNLANSYDAQDPNVQQALSLIRSKYAEYRIEVKPDAVAMEDFAQVKAERTEVIQGIAQFITSSQPMLAAMPGAGPLIGELLKWFISGIRGARSIEGELDRAMVMLEQQSQQPKPPAPPDPKVQAQQLKMQGDQAKAQTDMQKEQFKLQANLATIQAQTVAKDKEEQSQAYWNTQEKQAQRMIEGPKVTPPAPSHAGWTP